MKYQPPYGSSDPDAPYVDRNTPGVVTGSRVPARAIEHVQRELDAFIGKNGLVPDVADLLQVVKAARQQSLNYVVAGGTANALTVALDPMLTAHVAGMPLRVKVAATNTGAATLDAGPGALPIRTMRGADLARGDLPIDAVVTVICTGTAWALAGLAYSESLIPEVSPVLYVRTDGDDANDGQANTSARALATIAEAITRLRRYMLFNVPGQIVLGIAGTYAAPDVVAVNGNVEIIGNIANQDAYIIACQSGQSSVFTVNGGTVTTFGCFLQSPIAGTSIASATDGARLKLNNTSLKFTTGSGAYLVSTAYSGLIQVGAGCQLRGSAQSALRAGTGSQIQIAGAIAYTDSAAFSVANAYASTGSVISLGSGGSISGSATGARYNAVTNGVISTSGGGANFFPGSIAGSTATGGQYV